MRCLVFIMLFLKLTNSYGQKDNREINKIDSLKINNKKANATTIDNSCSYGVVVVKVIVDREGNVISVEPVLEKSTLKDSIVLKSAKEAALKAKFSKNSNASPKQIGFITYKFKLIDKK